MNMNSTHDTLNNVKVRNMIGHSGEPVKNQFIIRTDEGTYFQSYDSIIAFRAFEGPTYLDKNKWDYSITTGKYRNMFLGEDKKATEKRIKDGTYKLVDLNN